MNDRRVLEAVLVFLRERDGHIDVGCPDERDERHHLLMIDERMRFVSFAEHDLGVGGDADAGMFSEYCGVLADQVRSEEHTSELQSRFDLVCRLLLEKKKKKKNNNHVQELKFRHHPVHQY